MSQGKPTGHAHDDDHEATDRERTSKRRNSQDLVRFLEEIDETVPPAAGQQIIAIMDNLSTHKSKDTKAWLKAHPRWRFVFTPNHASWLNQVECLFSILARRVSSTATSIAPKSSPSRCSRSSKPATRPPHRSSPVDLHRKGARGVIRRPQAKTYRRHH